MKIVENPAINPEVIPDSNVDESILFYHSQNKKQIDPITPSIPIWITAKLYTLNPFDT